MNMILFLNDLPNSRQHIPKFNTQGIALLSCISDKGFFSVFSIAWMRSLRKGIFPRDFYVLVFYVEHCLALL